MRAFSGFPLNKGLRSIALNLPTDKKPVVEKAWRCKFSKEQILDMRAKYQFEGWNQARVQEFFKMTYDEAYRYLNYMVQRDLVPKRKAKAVH